MDTVHDDRYILYVRCNASRNPASPDLGEHPLASCGTYDEARRLRQTLQGAGTGQCVIRFVGPSGGGD